MSHISQALEVSRSHLHERFKKGQASRSGKNLTGEDRRLLCLIREITDERPTYGYHRVTALLRHKTTATINHKRIYRIMKVSGLLLTKAALKPQKNHDGKIITLKSNMRWCSECLQCSMLECRSGSCGFLSGVP